MIHPDKQQIVKILEALQNSFDKDLVMSVCEFIGGHFCNCKYVEYFVFDMDFGRNECHTEMAYELRDIHNIVQFVDFLYDLQDK